jgi:hypothetical protein
MVLGTRTPRWLHQGDLYTCFVSAQSMAINGSPSLAQLGPARQALAEADWDLGTPRHVRLCSGWTSSPIAHDVDWTPGASTAASGLHHVGKSQYEEVVRMILQRGKLPLRDWCKMTASRENGRSSHNLDVHTRQRLPGIEFSAILPIANKSCVC